MPKTKKPKKEKQVPAKSNSTPFFKPATKTNATASAYDIMTAENYIDNHINHIEFYFAEMAIIEYEDGTIIKLGLVNPWIKPPVEYIDYRTLRDEYAYSGASSTSAEILYRPEGDLPELTEYNKNLPFSEVMQLGSEHVEFKKDTVSNKIFPTVINSITAPQLCETLRVLEAEYIQSFDLSLEMMEAFTLMFASYYGSISFSGAGDAAALNKTLGNRTATTAYKLIQETDEFLINKFAELYSSGSAGEFVVNQVQFRGVEVLLEGESVVIRYGGIKKLGNVRGAGKAMHKAIEKNIKVFAQSLGKTISKVQVHTVQNTDLRDWLISIGYTLESVTITRPNGSWNSYELYQIIF